MSKRLLEPPSTPPRTRQATDGFNYAIDNAAAATPVTLSKGMLQTPVTTTKKQYYNSQIEPRFEPSHKRQKSIEQPRLDINLLSPEFTPAKVSRSPTASRSHRKYKDSMFELASPTRIKPSRKSTVGSGRRLGSALPSLKHSFLEDLTGSLHDYGRYEEIDISGSIEESSNDKFASAVEPFTPPQAPSTPGKKLITEELAREWYDKPRQDDDSDDEGQYGIFGLSQPQTNPFISTQERKQAVFNPFATSSKVDYSTHTELVDKKGNKTLRELSKSERAIRPKKLDFDEFAMQLPESPHQSHTSPVSLSFMSASSSPSPQRSPSLPPSSHKFYPSSPARFNRKNANPGEMGNKYVLKNLNNVMNMKSKNELDFEIYNDKNNSRIDKESP